MLEAGANRRTLLQGGAALLGTQLLGSAAAHDVAPVSAVRLHAQLDAHQLSDDAARGMVAMEVLERIEALPPEEQQRPELQSVVLRAGIWAGQSLLLLRDNLAAVVSGSRIDPDELRVALTSAIGPESSQQKQHLAQRIHRQMSSGRQRSMARRLIQRISRAERKAQHQLQDDAQERSAQLRASIRRLPLSLPSPEECAKGLMIILMLVALMILIPVVGVIFIIVGASTASSGLLWTGVALTVLGAALWLLLFLNTLPAAERPDSAA